MSDNTDRKPIPDRALSNVGMPTNSRAPLHPGWTPGASAIRSDIRRRLIEASAAVIAADDTYPDGHPNIRKALDARSAVRREAEAIGEDWCPWCGGSKPFAAEVPGGYGRCDHSFHGVPPNGTNRRSPRY